MGGGGRGGGTVAYYGTPLGLEETYMKEAPKSAGIVCKIADIGLFIDYHCNIFLAYILAEIKHFYWQPSWIKSMWLGGGLGEPCSDVDI